MASFVGSSISFMSSHLNKKWIIDTGANDHITSKFSCINSPISCAPNTSFIKLPNGDSVPINNLSFKRFAPTQCSLCSQIQIQPLIYLKIHQRKSLFCYLLSSYLLV